MPAPNDGPLSALEMSVVEQNAVALGVSIDAMMENAGRAVAEEVARRLPPPPARVVVLAGTGNNGGDGFAAAFYLAQWGYSPDVYLLRSPAEIRSPAARRCYDRLRGRVRLHVGPLPPGALDGGTLLVDAMLGSGQAGSLRSPYREAADALNAANVPVLAVDLPTGLGSPEAVRPRWTVALAAVKEGVARSSAGEIVVRDIGIPAAAVLETGPGDFLVYPRASPERGRWGRVAVVGGGPYSGAPALAALAALRAGAERVTVVAPEPSATAIRSYSPNLVVRAVGSGSFSGEDAVPVATFLRNTPLHALVLGMGLGAEASAVEFAARVLGELGPEVRTVVDAEALTAMRELGEDRRPKDAIATPNLGEYQHRLGGHRELAPPERLEEVAELASRFGVTLLVKGELDLVSDGRRRAVNRHHPPAQAVAGAGDVLAGVLGGLLARGVDTFLGGRLAAYWTGAAGYLAHERLGEGLAATDLVDALGPALVAGLARVRPSGAGPA
ncbi:MAG TPA: NAD(P)H-hydrate dehydratase [Thermoplasmata archaeon]|nr:NAD(P)H-hydrate dehydratase [Thermoplasmata archaeon]